MDLTVRLPDEVKYILYILNRNGYEAYIVGGCVRDSIMGLSPGDWDITTNAHTDVLRTLFDRTIDTGVKHGTVTVMLNSQGFEVTTYRIDGRYEDNRRPVKVEFTSSIEADLSRRDFTMNAIAYNPDKGIVDPFYGISDINGRLIRTVGNADERFKEDALRMLRAVRFSSRLDFSVHEDALRSIRENSHLVCVISRERVRDELTGILTSDHPMRFIMLRDTNILQYILPEFEICFHTPQNNPYHIYNVAVHSLYAAAAIGNDAGLRWTMLLHDIGKPLSRTTGDNGIDHFYGHPEKGAGLAAVILDRLRFDKKSMERITRLVRYHDREIQPAHRAVRCAAAAVGGDIFDDLLKVKEADKMAQNPLHRDQGLACISGIRQIYNEIKMDNQCLSLKNLAVNGCDLLALGFLQGRELGDVLERLLAMAINEPGMNDKDRLLKLAEKMLREKGSNNV